MAVLKKPRSRQIQLKLPVYPNIYVVLNELILEAEAIIFNLDLNSLAAISKPKACEMHFERSSLLRIMISTWSQALSMLFLKAPTG
jgi:hypothetical protein